MSDIRSALPCLHTIFPRPEDPIDALIKAATRADILAVKASRLPSGLTQDEINSLADQYREVRHALKSLAEPALKHAKQMGIACETAEPRIVAVANGHEDLMDWAYDNRQDTPFFKKKFRKLRVRCERAKQLLCYLKHHGCPNNDVAGETFLETRYVDNRFARRPDHALAESEPGDEDWPKPKTIGRPAQANGASHEELPTWLIDAKLTELQLAIFKLLWGKGEVEANAITKELYKDKELEDAGETLRKHVGNINAKISVFRFEIEKVQGRKAYVLVPVTVANSQTDSGKKRSGRSAI